jgi:DNA repair protein RadA
MEEPEEPMVSSEEIREIEDLPSVGPSTAKKLREAGYETVEDLAVASPVLLSGDLAMSEETTAIIVRAARAVLKMGFETGDEILRKRDMVEKISTGSKRLDDLLGGGIETQAITELYGEFASGKTQIAHQAAVMVQLPREDGGVEGRVIYIDTEHTFRPERIIQIAENLGKDASQILRNISVGSARSSDHQLELARKAGGKAKEWNVKLLVVDSLTSFFRSEYTGRALLAERQQKLNRHVHELQKLADLHNLAVLVTNQVLAKVDVILGDQVAPVGGNIIAHQCTHRVFLRKAKGNKRIARLVDSPYLPEGETVFTISEGGIGD